MFRWMADARDRCDRHMQHDASHDRSIYRVSGLAWIRRLLVGAVFFLTACATNTAPTQSATSSAPTIDTQAQAFAKLNRINQRARRLRNPVAAYLLLAYHYEHSRGLLHDFIGQVIAATQSEFGAYQRAVVDYPQVPVLLSHQSAPLPTPQTAHAVDAVDAIATLARDRRIVMVNEVHHAAQTRLLTLDLLPRLRKMGFNYFAVEALNERDSNLSTRGYPIASSGTYIREPIYAEIIRSAIRLGYHVVAYDSTASGADPDQRERDQAAHMIERVFRRDPGARLFVHAGYAHVDKRADYFYTDTLAMRLARATGFDPLSIDQTVLRPIAPGREYADYRRLIQRFAPTRPTVLMMRHADKAWSLEPDIYDISVLLPPAQLLHGRPDWLDLNGLRTPVAVKPGPRQPAVPYVIEARHAGESSDAIPADRELIFDSTIVPVLFLRPGQYRIDVLTANDRPRFVRTLHVDLPENAGSE